MKAMQDYTNYCTDMQIIRARQLGAPIYVDKNGKIKLPTTQQMMGWLREQGVNAYVGFDGIGVYSPNCFVGNSLYQADIAPDKLYTSYEQAELAAIDVALDYLEKKGE